MAANGAAAQAFAPVLTAVDTMQSSADREKKQLANTFLDKFQKTSEAWNTSFAILQADNSDVNAQQKMFAAVTLKGKIIYDLHQLPRDSLTTLRNTIISLLNAYRAGPKPIRTQLCVCLADLAIQMTEWKDVMDLVVKALGSNPESIPCVLEFLHVLPEEVTEGRKINLSEDELLERTQELLTDNAPTVLRLLAQYSQSSPAAARNPQLLECITSWSREVQLNDIVNSSLLDTIINALDAPDAFDAAVECLSTIMNETRDVDECMSTIQTLYPRIIQLRPKLAQAAEEEDTETFRGFSRIFAEAGEAWVLLVCRMPVQFRPLVEGILETAARDTENEAIRETFKFWYELKQYVTLERYMDARLQFADIYSKLVDVMIGHLEYPTPESGDEKDLFEGDREQEERFREFRHQMGDVLKDCCEVIGVTECLQKSYNLIQEWVSKYGAQSSSNHVVNWQKLEAPLFSLRAMGMMVPNDENAMLPRLMALIVQIPDQEKVRFQAVMALGRYTEWTANHPDTLQPQLQYIMSAFDHPSKEVIRAAALSFKFFCSDCADLLKDYNTQIQQFYVTHLDKLPPSSQDEFTDGVAAVLARQPVEHLYESMKLYCDPVMNSLMALAQTAQNSTGDEAKIALADRLQLITIFIQVVRPEVPPGAPNPAVKYCQEIFPILATLVDNFIDFSPIIERVTRCWRHMVLSYRTALAPLLPDLARKLADGFSASRQGAFLWASDSIVREFSEVGDGANSGTDVAIFQFYEQQARTFFGILNNLPPEQVPDVLEDFFRLSTDILLFQPQRTIVSNLQPHVLASANQALTLLKVEPLSAALHYLRDFLAYGMPDSPSSTFEPNQDPSHAGTANPPELRAAVKQLLLQFGEEFTHRLMAGMMYTFPRDVFPDASGALLAMFQLLPAETATWVKQTVELLPAGTISPQEKERLAVNIKQRIENGDIRKIRIMLQDFTNQYRRRNVAPREGLGRLEATRFRFSG
ncbi:ARM repeat-containing protein [Rhizodiscina lignyota]|uniref:ARM repeat-containing protein n=1 Tax=Rhizodiscina lignyota TaxID=1504668 RepID=A0A9P4M2A6_9PEZI|nr:ARM repeat-containing protein [Rhizodiscina lignyota]